MAEVLNIVLAQYDFVVGDIEGNCQKVIELSNRARDELQADLVVFPELTLTSYPPEDLLLRPGLYRQVNSAMMRLLRNIQGVHVLLGYPYKDGDEIYNAASLIYDGEEVVSYFKQTLPNYGVFDEKRYFTAGQEACVFTLKGIKFGVSICEDVWVPSPVAKAKAAGADLIINLNASPYHVGKSQERYQVLRRRCHETALPIVYVNLVGGQDELVFDGSSMVVDEKGNRVACFPSFEEDLYGVKLRKQSEKLEFLDVSCTEEMSLEANVYKGICRGVRDYVNKNQFNGVVIGLSGGIDSALTLAIAVDALGADQVEVIMMPSPYTAEISLQDAKTQAATLGVVYHEISIEAIFQTILKQFYQEFPFKDKSSATVTEENIQARVRGLLLMAYSNLSGRMVLTTGNKSEMSVGYATLYGDMAGGFAPLKDVPKTLVYALAEYRNSLQPVIPQRVIERAPSAELSPGQKDQDLLPPYDVLDEILRGYIELDLCPEQIIEDGYDAQTVWKVVEMVDKNEYKRRQAPPGVRITRRAFGRDRRYPITSGYQSI